MYALGRHGAGAVARLLVAALPEVSLCAPEAPLPCQTTND